jgi:hypothetical protein
MTVAGCIGPPMYSKCGSCVWFGEQVLTPQPDRVHNHAHTRKPAAAVLEAGGANKLAGAALVELVVGPGAAAAGAIPLLPPNRPAPAAAGAKDAPPPPPNRLGVVEDAGAAAVTAPKLGSAVPENKLPAAAGAPNKLAEDAGGFPPTR